MFLVNLNVKVVLVGFFFFFKVKNMLVIVIFDDYKSLIFNFFLWRCVILINDLNLCEVYNF